MIKKIKPAIHLPVQSLLVIIAALFITTELSAQRGRMVMEPPPGISPDNELFQKGFLDVTLMGADPTGQSISTQAIRESVWLARDHHLACYFPPGTYVVDDTILCRRDCVPAGNGWRTANHQTLLVGSAENRPLIKLVEGAPKFQDPENPLPVFWLYSMSAYGQQPECEGSIDPLCVQSNINFNQMVKGIDIDLGGNPGAIGIRHPGAQGATIEDVKINATGAFSGLYNPPGQAGGTHNVVIEGGQYGMYLQRVGRRQQGKFIIMTGCVFKNQEKAAFRIDLVHPMVVVGFHIIKDSGPINENLPGDGLTLVDGVIELGGGPVISGNGSSLYMRNVYVKGADEIANGWTVPDKGKLNRIEEYSYCEPRSSTNLVDGILNKEEYRTTETIGAVSVDALARALILRHVWDDKTFPHFEMPGVVNVKDPSMMNGHPAKGDGDTDDSKALEYAIANYEKIFLPKGIYAISKTLTLGKNSQLFGAGRTLTSINPMEGWSSGKDAPLIETVDDPDAATSLSFLSARTRGTPSISWKAGRNSRVRDVTAGPVVISGNGGGRWTAFSNVTSPLAIKGTSQPLSIYATNPERAIDPEWGIYDSENIQLYYVKTEAGTDGYSIMTSLRITNSRNISIFGSTGNVQLNGSGGKGMIEVINSEDVIVTHAHPFKKGEDWNVFKEVHDGKTTNIPSATRLATFKRGAPVIDKPHLQVTK